METMEFVHGVEGHCPICELSVSAVLTELFGRILDDTVFPAEEHFNLDTPPPSAVRGAV
jgi:hypothetical protein